MRLNHVAIEFLSQDFRLTAGCRNNRQRMDCVFYLLWIATVNVGDPFAVRAPRWRAVPIRMRIGLGRGRDLAFFPSGFRRDYPYVPILRPVRILPALGD